MTEFLSMNEKLPTELVLRVLSYLHPVWLFAQRLLASKTLSKMLKYTGTLGKQIHHVREMNLSSLIQPWAWKLMAQRVKERALSLLFQPNQEWGKAGVALAYVLSEESGEKEWFQPWDKKIQKDAARVSRKGLMLLLRGRSWGGQQAAVAPDRAHTKKLDSGVWSQCSNQKLYTEAAETLGEEALRLLSDHYWARGQAGIDLARIFGVKSSDDPWFRSRDQRLLRDATEISIKEGLRLLSESSRRVGIDLARVLSVKAGDEACYHIWYRNLQKMATILFGYG